MKPKCAKLGQFVNTETWSRPPFSAVWSAVDMASLKSVGVEKLHPCK